MRLSPLLIVAIVAVVGCSAPLADEGEGSTASHLEGGSATCSPDRAAGSVNEFQKALHDAIAFAEGTSGHGDNDGYDIGFAYKVFKSCSTYPGLKTCSGKYCSSAAGRYQFLSTTWAATAKAIDASSFEPDEQERGAEHLIKNVRKVTVPEGRPMTATEFATMLKKLSYEWASLPPGRYGQPIKSASQMRSKYCELVTGGC